uniref:Mitochondrial splicing suppressor 51-like C-terminal domain-containing protein n=1 Tax=Chaetoceros debilis TaxID=122233 RepID=A0A7S3V415_9STRA|mmetsp:Transcript_9752/g.14631  ORF Transcript_9752/g.14631 Transcript_9752/m.14631 type:complete len:352 (+) Transcript_9752:135-1190(+)
MQSIVQTSRKKISLQNIALRYFRTQDSSIVNEYARKHPEIAQKALQVPVPPLSYQETTCMIDAAGYDLDEYLTWRKWEKKYIDNSMTNILLSHALSFPLTLGANAHHFWEDGRRRGEPIKINLCCVGSRAEAQLPDEFWREFLTCANLFHEKSRKKLKSEHHADTGTSTAEVNWSLDFIGPDVSRNQLGSRKIFLEGSSNSELAHNRANAAVHKSLTLNYHSDFLHNHVLNLYKSNTGTNSAQDILQRWDGFIFFNPGIGHPNHRKSWKPSIDFVLKTKKKFIMTAHSSLDHKRDLATLQYSMEDIGDERHEDLEYRNNNFASRMSYVDTCHNETNGEHIVRPNHSILISS